VSRELLGPNPCGAAPPPQPQLLGSVFSSHVIFTTCSKASFLLLQCTYSHLLVRALLILPAVADCPSSIISLLRQTPSAQSMPDRTDGTTAPGTSRTEHTNKRGSTSIETATPDVDSGSKGSNASPVPSGASATETSPKKRRKVNHGQNGNPLAPGSVVQDTDLRVPSSLCLLPSFGEL
jgi:hypothetical protein